MWNEQQLRHGVADWLYEKYLFGDRNAFWFSPNDELLAWASFNWSEIKSYSYNNFLQFNDSVAEPKAIVYPKVSILTK